jgi:peptidoglycan/xylan/chitin deacetylase (PgdA/CDA1 family)
MADRLLAIKVDVDTERGTRIGVPALLELLNELDIRATFLFSVGPDNTGRAIRRIFRRGFFGKVARTSVVSTYGLRTLLNGVLWPGPHIGRRHAGLMRSVRDAGHEVGIHCYDHVRWQDGLASMNSDQVAAEFARARGEFERIFGVPARTAGAAGWQANAFSLAAYDAAALEHASDTRGSAPFFPSVQGKVYRTLQIPTTLPTLDELLGRPEFPYGQLVDRYLSWMGQGHMHVYTAHAEIEGMKHLDLFRQLLTRVRERSWQVVPLGDIARHCLAQRDTVAVCSMVNGEIEGRSGTLAMQGKALA